VILSYSTPPPDLPGSANLTLTTSGQEVWRDVHVGQLNDGDRGKDIERVQEIPSFSEGAKEKLAWNDAFAISR